MGKRVSAWTSANGTYVGVLRRVTDDKPWRAIVEVDGVASVAVHYELRRGGGYVFRRGFRVGQEIEVGGTNVEPTEAVGHADYLDLLRLEVSEMEGRLGKLRAEGSLDRFTAHLPGSVQAMKDALARLGEEASPRRDRVRFTVEDEAYCFRLTPESDAVVAAIQRGLDEHHASSNPGTRPRWPAKAFPSSTSASSDKEWRIPKDEDALRAVALALDDGPRDEVAALLLERIREAGFPQAPTP